MELRRKPYQGVFNIIRFNWHFYVFSGLFILVVFKLKQYLPNLIQSLVLLLLLFGIIIIVISLMVSYFVYDYSDLYRLNWLSNLNDKKVLNINAGFDETSAIIKDNFSKINLTICDFYDSDKHTEVSIKRARKAYPPSNDIIKVNADKLPFDNNSFSTVIAILSAHEIRSCKERIVFFNELNRVTKTGGQIFVTEHLRDLNNFLAYNIGFLHFYSKSNWLKTFEHAGLTVKQEVKTTPFISTFILQKNGNTF